MLDDHTNNKISDSIGGVVNKGADRIANSTSLKGITDYAKYNGSHKFGLNYVPVDNYVANLHKGEMVLNQSSANMLRALSMKNKTLSNPL